MTRISLMVAVAMAAGVVGCAHCDTCDDFPAPCAGPNCGPSSGATGLEPAMVQGAPMRGPMAFESAGPAPGTPPATPSVSVPPADAASSPTPMEPARL